MSVSSDNVGPHLSSYKENIKNKERLTPINEISGGVWDSIRSKGKCMNGRQGSAGGLRRGTGRGWRTPDCMVETWHSGGWDKICEMMPHTGNEVYRE